MVMPCLQPVKYSQNQLYKKSPFGVYQNGFFYFLSDNLKKGIVPV